MLCTCSLHDPHTADIFFILLHTRQVCGEHPEVTIVTSEIDRGINEDFVVVPGIGEFGDRFFSA